MAISVIKKRDGRIVPFDVQKISDAIAKSFAADEPNRDHEDLSDSLAWEVYSLLELEGDPAPTVEHVQDIVEQVLMREGYSQTAKSYILYRQERTNVRNRETQGRGTVTVYPPAGETTLAAQTLAVYRAVRDNGGCQSLCGFYDAMGPGVAEAFGGLYEDFLRLALELTTGTAVNAETLRSIDAALLRLNLPQQLGKNESRNSRQVDLICGACGFDRAPVERAQKAALRQTQEALERRVRRTVTTLLGVLETAGCAKDAIDRGTAQGPEVDLLRTIVEA